MSPSLIGNEVWSHCMSKSAELVMRPTADLKSSSKREGHYCQLRGSIATNVELKGQLKMHSAGQCNIENCTSEQWSSKKFRLSDWDLKKRQKCWVTDTAPRVNDEFTFRSVKFQTHICPCFQNHFHVLSDCLLRASQVIHEPQSEDCSQWVRQAKVGLYYRKAVGHLGRRPVR